MTPYPELFHELTGNPPYPYQLRLATEPWPAMLDVATGMGKTAAVLGAWLYKRLNGDSETGTRLVYCLPMRTLVEQTAAVAADLIERSAARFAAAGLERPEVHVLMGGVSRSRWDETPERPQILVGTQDMLLSRALNRGYAMSRFRWPVQFGLLNNDCLWVLDETQLMGVGVETSAQLQGFRAELGAFGPARTLWMSATLGAAQLQTIDHPRPADGWQTLELDDADRDNTRVRDRLEARKALARAEARLEAAEDSYLDAAAAEILAAHRDRGGLTLVVVNRVARAQKLFARLEPSVPASGLVHSRFRAADRARHQALLGESGDRLVVATQAVEAGVDVSATTLFTELAPWSSVVQRLGRCNRYGEIEGAMVRWFDIDTSNPKDGLALPYEPEELDVARELLGALDDAGPAALREVDYEPPPVIRPVIRRCDLVELFDTTPDLAGDDVDVSRFVRDSDDTDVSLFWRPYDESAPDADAPSPGRDELCRVSIGAAKSFAAAITKRRKRLSGSTKPKDRERARALSFWRWNPLDKKWSRADSPRPGEALWVHPDAGGYDPGLGWTGEPEPATAVEPVVPELRDPPESYSGDPDSARDRWIRLTAHLGHVEAESRSLAAPLTSEWLECVAIAARWHDVGKAHQQFQDRLVLPVADDPELGPPDPDQLWAKSGHRRSWRKGRPCFRHELASALAWLATDTGVVGRERDLIAYLIAAHHGKIRVSIRSLPVEKAPRERGRLYARGVWDGDELPAVTLPTGEVVGPETLSLEIMQMGIGSWIERVVSLRDDPELGPLRLAYLESLVRIGDWRASDKEQGDGYDD